MLLIYIYVTYIYMLLIYMYIYIYMLYMLLHFLFSSIISVKKTRIAKFVMTWSIAVAVF